MIATEPTHTSLSGSATHQERLLPSLASVWRAAGDVGAGVLEGVRRRQAAGQPELGALIRARLHDPLRIRVPPRAKSDSGHLSRVRGVAFQRDRLQSRGGAIVAVEPS